MVEPLDKEKNVVEEAIKEAKEAAKEVDEEIKTETDDQLDEDAQKTPESDTEIVVEDTDQEVEAAEESNQEQEAAVDNKDNKFFKKKKKKDKKDEQIEELTDKLTRQMAEFDNFRKRTTKEKSMMYEVGAKEVIEKILPVVDNLERGIAAIPEEEKSNPFIEGMDKIYKQLMTTLEEIGVKAIEAVGTEFNPDLHNAVMHVEEEELSENVVAEEFQKGYMYHESVIRHSMVKVAN